MHDSLLASATPAGRHAAGKRDILLLDAYKMEMGGKHFLQREGKKPSLPNIICPCLHGQDSQAHSMHI
jgi:hypothetical protein